MAGSSCSLTCNVVDTNTGHIKVSQLWKDLTRFMKKNRAKALAHYFLTKDNNFLMENSRNLEFDVDGEVTIESLKKVLDPTGEYSDLSNNIVLATLNEELNKQRYEYSNALEEVLKFNRSGKFKENFMATLNKESDGKYKVSVVKRSSDAEYELANHVQNKIITEAIRTLLKDRGLSVEFLDNPSYAVKYDTLNAERDPITGLYSVVSILNGINTKAEIAEAAGHFIVDAMIDNPMVQRLLDKLSIDVQKYLFKDHNSPLYRSDFLVSNSSAREAAGILIGNKLLEPFKKAEQKVFKPISPYQAAIKSIKWLLGKIGKGIEKMFGMFDPMSIDKLAEQAMREAQTVAQGYINYTPDVNMEDVINRINVDKAMGKEGDDGVYEGVNVVKRLSDDARYEIKAYNEMLDDLKKLTANLKDIVGRTVNTDYKDVYDLLNSFEKRIESEFSSYVDMSNAFSRQAAISGMTEMLEGMVELLDNDVRRLLDNIQPSNRAQAYANISQNGKDMAALNHIILSIAQMYQLMQNKLNTLQYQDPAQFRDADDKTITSYLYDAMTRLGNVLMGETTEFTDAVGAKRTANGIFGILDVKRFQIFVDAFKEFYGEDYVNIAAGRVWENYKLVSKQPERKTIGDYINSMVTNGTEIGWFDRYMMSAADSGDFFTSVGRMVTGAANTEADRIAFRFLERLIESELQMQELFGDTNWDRLLETTTDDNGKTVRTGNFLNRDNYGEWEKAREKAKAEIKEAFYDELARYRKEQIEKNKGVKGYAFSLSDTEKGVIYHSVMAPMMKKFNQEHSVKGPDKRWRPNPKKYHSAQWDTLFDTSDPTITEQEKSLRRRRLKWYESFLEMKKEMDSLLPKGATSEWRAPQFSGRAKHIFRNLKKQYGLNRKTVGFWIRKKMSFLWDLKDDEAWKFGCDNDFNNISDDPLENKTFYKRGMLDRIPIFGVNKLTKMEELSTDIFGSMLRYASMAATYNCMESVADIFEIGKDVLKNRRIPNGKNFDIEKYSHKESNIYSRYIRFVEKNVYQVNTDPIKWDRRGNFRKFATKVASFGGLSLLYGNMHGGFVNTGTGVFEAFKEALAGENYDLKEFNKANEMYFKDIFPIVAAGLIDKQMPQNKTSLWIRHWNIRMQNRDFLRNLKFDVNAMSLIDNRLSDWFGSSMMLPYSSGEHYMQTIPYYAMGFHDKVYDINGHEMSLIDAYDEVDGREVFAIEADENDEPLGKTPKKLQLRDNIFKSANDAIKYKRAANVLDKIDRYLEKHENDDGLAPIVVSEIFDEGSTSDQEERRMLFFDKEGFNFGEMPTTKNGLATLKKALELKIHDLKFNESDEIEFMQKCRNICNRLHGIYNQEDRVALQQNFYFGLATQMKGYAFGMINRRYAPSTFNATQRKVVEGSSNSASKVILAALGAAANDIVTSQDYPTYLEATLMMMPFGQLLMFNNKYSNMLKADMQRAGFSPHQYYNIRRFAADYLLIEALWLTKLLSGPGMHFGLSDDEDEEGKKVVDTSDNVAAGILYYLSYRWLAEQSAFTTFSGFKKDSSSLLDYIPVGLSGANAWWEIISLAAKTWYTDDPDRTNKEIYYQKSKKGKYKAKDPKWWVKFKSLIPYYRSYYVATHPYDAASGWEYGRKVRNR